MLSLANYPSCRIKNKSAQRAQPRIKPGCAASRSRKRVADPQPTRSRWARSMHWRLRVASNVLGTVFRIDPDPSPRRSVLSSADPASSQDPLTTAGGRYPPPRSRSISPRRTSGLGSGSAATWQTRVWLSRHLAKWKRHRSFGTHANSSGDPARG
jgi:hypothetical protein